MTGRSVPLWVGSSPDARVPPRVRLRIFEREGGRCWLTKRKIMPGDVWELDHIQALCNGGRHSEDNLAPALVDAHREKTRADVGQRAKADRIRKKHIGAWPAPKRKLQGRGFAPSRNRQFEQEKSR